MFTKLASYFGGRHTMFACCAIVIGVTMSWYHRLDSNLVTLLLGLQTTILAHSIKEDHYNGSGS